MKSFIRDTLEINVNKIWWLNVSYDEKTDTFFAYVDDGTREGNIIYQIDDTDEMCGYINTGVMSHIDDADGLTKFLIKQEFIVEGDIVKVNQELLW